MNLKTYLEKSESEFSLIEILYSLCDGEFLAKFDTTQEEVENLYDYYLNKTKEV